ncbi:MAG: hypothetical protein A3G93_15150 [Nitrospinae bacterium RIFCSPLOWO2_12_FULL_45_22]|nr:MAG: hypothetical protein A3G93_15150 [Nitrospinae bacterium RIFCSPLOWO2_12_FULL_45_22]
MSSNNKILLIAPKLFKGWDYQRNFHEISPPLGLLSIGTVLHEEGFEVKIIDASISEDYLKDIENYLLKKPLYAGISAMTSQVSSGIDIAEYIRKMSPNTLLVWGGIHATLFPQQTCSDPLADLVVIGEGEYSCLELTKSLRQSHQIPSLPGLGYKKDGKFLLNLQNELADINKFPFPYFDLLPMDSYLTRDFGGTRFFFGEQQKSIILHTGVGCPYDCTFCINNSLAQSLKRYRGKTADRILDEIDMVINKYQVRHIVFRDDNFLLDKKRFIRFLDGLEERRYKITWYCTARADFFHEGYLSETLVQRMANLGCARISIGVESGSEKIINLLKKGINLNQVRHAATLCKRYGIIIAYSFMMGLPGEEPEDTLKTLNFIGKLVRFNPKDFILGPQIFRPYPGSALYQECINKGFTPPDSLREWANNDLEDTSGYLGLNRFPWLKKPKFYFYINFAFKKGILRSYRELPLRSWWLKAIFESRKKLNLWSFLFEVKIAGVLSQIKERMLSLK